MGLWVTKDGPLSAVVPVRRREFQSPCQRADRVMTTAAAAHNGSRRLLYASRSGQLKSPADANVQPSVRETPTAARDVAMIFTVGGGAYATKVPRPRRRQRRGRGVELRRRRCRGDRVWGGGCALSPENV